MKKILIISGQDVDKRIPIIKKSQNFDFVVLGTSHEIEHSFRAEHIEYRFFPMKRRLDVISDLQSVLHIARIIKKEKPDLIQSYDTKPNFLTRVVALIMPGACVVSTINGLGELYTYDTYRNKIYRKIFETINRFLMLRTEMLIFQNKDDYQYYRKKKMVNRRYAIVAGSGVDTDYFDVAHYRGQDRVSEKMRLIGSDKKFVVTMITRVVKSKGVVAFAKIADSIKKRRNDVEMLLVGPDDRHSDDRLSESEKNYLRQKVNWIGERKDIRDILFISDIFLLLSRYREGIPRVVMEAAAMDVPSIVFDVPGCNDIIENGRNGFVVNHEGQIIERIEKMITDPEMLKGFGLEARERMEENFSLDVISRRMNVLWNSILERKGQ